MSFSFGAKPATGGFGAQATNLTFGSTTPQTGLFGATPAQPTQGFGAAANAAPSTGLFGAAPAQPQQTGLTFGATNTGLSFGTPAASAAPPAFGSGFGATQSTFGATPNTGLTFGAAAAKPGGLTFGTPATTASTGLSFGMPAANTGLSFGTPAASTGMTFGTPTASTGLTFGTPASTGLTFGTPAASTGLTFGTPAASTGLTFGTPAASTGLTFGTPASTGLTFGTPAANTGLNFGTPAASTGLNFGTTTSTAAPTLGLSFGNPTSSAAPTLNFGTPATNTGLSFGLGTQNTTFNLGGATSVAATPANVGLGGIATSTPCAGTATKTTEQAPKEQNLPNEIQQTVESFKNFVKQQKGYSSDVARYSIKEFRRVEADIDAVNNLLNDVEKQLQMNKNVAEKLKYDTARGLQQVEMAQRTYDTPMGLQYENTAPLQFFMELVDGFEREMQNMKLQIENTDKYVKNIGKSAPLSSQDLAMGMRRIHETFVALAGRLQSVHSQVESQKEQYLNFRKHMLNDATNVFDKNGKESDALNVALNTIHFQPPKISTGPTPFNATSHPSLIQAAAQNSPAQPSRFGNSFQLSMSIRPNNAGSLFGGSPFGQSFNSSAAATSFQLQKPPTGSKRGKQ